MVRGLAVPSPATLEAEAIATRAAAEQQVRTEGTGQRVAVAVVAASIRAEAGIRAILQSRPGMVMVELGEAEVVVVDGEGEVPEGLAVVRLVSPESPGPLPSPSRPGGAVLSREASDEAIAAAVMAAAAGLYVSDPDLDDEAERGESAGSELTPREMEVLRLLADGQPNKGIAFALGISDHTAKFHVGSILSKLDAGSRTEAVAIAIRRGMLPL